MRSYECDWLGKSTGPPTGAARDSPSKGCNARTRIVECSPVAAWIWRMCIFGVCVCVCDMYDILTNHQEWSGPTPVPEWGCWRLGKIDCKLQPFFDAGPLWESIRLIWTLFAIPWMWQTSTSEASKLRASLSATFTSSAFFIWINLERAMFLVSRAVSGSPGGLCFFCSRSVLIQHGPHASMVGSGGWSGTS